MNFAPAVVNVLGFKVNTLDRNSILSFGPLQQADYFQSNKRNQAFGEQNGDGTIILFPLNLLSDQDIYDANSVKGRSIL